MANPQLKAALPTRPINSQLIHKFKPWRSHESGMNANLEAFTDGIKRSVEIRIGVPNATADSLRDRWSTGKSGHGAAV